MKAIVITQPGDADVLQLQDVPKPAPGPGQVLIHVKAAGLNRSDLLQREGKYGGDPSGQIPGLEVAGLIETCGPDANQWLPGDAVCALIANGGYAEYVVVDERHCLPVPSDMPMTEAASWPETLLTVWSNIFQSAALRAGEHFLVHGGSSGIGITAIQLAKAFGAVPFATAGSDDKAAFCESIGAIRCVNYKTQDFETELKSYGIDVILDMVGGDYTAKNLRLLRTDGRLMFINAMNGPKSEINIMEIMTKRLVVSGSTLKPRDAVYKARLTADVAKHVWPLVTRGDIKPVIHAVFPLGEAAEAHRLMASSQHTGKIILDLS